MALSNYYYSTSTQPLAEQERLLREQRDRQLCLQELAQQQSEMAYRKFNDPYNSGLNEACMGQRRAVHAQEPQKPELNKVLLLCS